MPRIVEYEERDGGIKKRQDQDIQEAHARWKAYKSRKRKE